MWYFFKIFATNIPLDLVELCFKFFPLLSGYIKICLPDRYTFRIWVASVKCVPNLSSTAILVAEKYTLRFGRTNNDVTCIWVSFCLLGSETL